MRSYKNGAICRDFMISHYKKRIAYCKETLKSIENLKARKAVWNGMEETEARVKANLKLYKNLESYYKNEYVV